MTAVYIHHVIRPVLTVVFLGGCRMGFDQVGATARGDAAGAVDAPADAPAPTGPFGTPVAVTSLNAGGDADDPTLPADQLEIIFNSARTGSVGGNDLWTAKRASTADAWSTPTDISELNTAGDDATPEITRDGLTLYWVANGAAGMKDIWMATRPDRGSPWANKTRIVELASAADESGPTLTPDGLLFIFSTNPTATDDLYASTRATTAAAWSTPAVINGLNMAGVDDGEPFINGTGTFILWSSARTGGGDIYMARRADRTQPWGAPMAVGELNTAAMEGDPWLSPDEHVIYFSRSNAIYTASR